jgi:hypothetical protein
MHSYYVEFYTDESSFKLLRLINKKYLPGIYADGYDYYDAEVLYPSITLTGNVNIVSIRITKKILEFEDDDSALLWFRLNYGG